ncbi:hypothetical protein C8J57DRAFT_1215009 [Mycena rebaudengoi]|nr:hypothetical protein C8J57DRAFT_1215009 [Mycena rebaudengoi]
MGLRHLEAEIHLGKTEYLESHQIQISIISNLQLTQSGHHALMASLNMALIDISTGVDSKVILKNLEACGYHMRTFNTLSGFNQILTLHMLDLATANLNLRDGNHVAANTMFSLFLMDIMLECLEQLADLSTEMNNIQNTLRWAGIFLSLALISNEQLAMMKALSCLGQLTVVEGDDETALSLFTVALDGFTFMDVHCWRGDCMVQIADIYDKRGEPAKSVELWKTARPLFQRSSQANSVTWIDIRLSEVALAVLERHEKQLQQLAKMNVPVGELDETKIVDIDIDSADQNQIPSGLWRRGTPSDTRKMMFNLTGYAEKIPTINLSRPSNPFTLLPVSSFGWRDRLRNDQFVKKGPATIWHCPTEMRVFKDRQDGHHRAKFETQIAP